MSTAEYHVIRRNGVVTCQVSRVVDGETVVKSLANIGLHSPDGFEMGYGGSGPSDLSLTILCDYFGVAASKEAFMSGDMNDGQRLAWELHHAFKTRFIAPHNQAILIRGDEIDKLVNDSIQITMDIPDLGEPPEEVH
jgi:hypothetical protein